MYKASKVVLVDNMEVRDTDTRFSERAMDLRAAIYWSMEVMNRTDKQLTITTVAGGREVPASLGDLGSSQTVDAGQNKPLALSNWSPWIGVKFNFAVAPTKGDLRIEGWIQEEADAN